jgi:hypothetical protein
MPPAALISLAASRTPLLKFVPAILPAPVISTKFTIVTGLLSCAEADGASNAARIAAASERMIFILGSSHSSNADRVDLTEPF